MNMKLEFIPLVMRLKNNQNIYKLNDKYFEKFCRKSKFIVKLLLGPLFIACILVNIIPYGYLSIEAYFDPEMDFSLIELIINYILFTICFSHSIAISWASVVVCYISTLYLKYHFKQIQECVETGNTMLLIDTIHEHNYFTELTGKLNEMMPIGLGIVYFCGTPGIDILLHLAIYSENSYISLFYALFFIQAFGCILLFVSTLSAVSTAAHNISSDLHKFLTRKHVRKIPLSSKLKILAFIEKLYGPSIGFYCFDWFPFTYLELYEYMYFVSSTYFLLNGLIF